MSFRTVLIVLLAVLCGGSSVAVLRGINQPTAASEEKVPVVVTTLDVQRGSPLLADHIKVKDFPKDLVPPGALTKVEDALDRVALYSLSKGEPVLGSKVGAKGGGKANLIPKGMRAVSILTPSAAASVSGFIIPGNKVDVLLTMEGDARVGGPRTSTLLQNVEIWAVDQLVEVPADSKGPARQMQSVTLLVKPEQAVILDLAQNKGILHFTLRNPQDSAHSDTQPFLLARLLGYQEKPWSEQLKGVLEGVAQVMDKLPKEPPPPKPEVVVKKPVRKKKSYAEVRILQGVGDSAVRIGIPSADGTDNDD